MLTHSQPNGQFDNILMADEHFEKGHEVVCTKTHFVNQLFIKFEGWGAFYKGGKLTANGIEFINSNLSNTQPKTFDEYPDMLC